MGDLQSLLLVLVVIYLAECVVWVRRGAVAFVSGWSLAKHRWRLWQPDGIIGNQRGAVCFANPLPPLGAVTLGQPLPLSVSADAVFAYTAACLNPGWRPAQSARFVRFADIQEIEREGKRVLVNGRVFLNTASTSAARRLVSWLRRLKETPAPQRDAAIRQSLADGFCAEKVHERLDAFARLARPIRALSNSLLVVLFVLGPAAVWRFGLAHTVWVLVPALLAHTVTIAILFRRAYRRLYPQDGDEWFTPFLTMLLAPPSAIRANDVLGRHLLEDFHALAVAQVLCPPRSFREFARRTLLDLRYPMLPACPVGDPAMTATEHEFRAALRNEAERFVVSHGLELGELLRPPAPSEPVNTAYCPRCGAQFVTEAGVCGDCGGRPLEQFSAKAGVTGA